METDCTQRLMEITDKFKTCRRALAALGNDTRQGIILALLESDYNGVRVGEITQKAHLSRPAVSHHLRILMEAGIVNRRREATKNYYYIDSNESLWETLHDLLGLVCTGIRQTGKCDPRKEK